jgi:hypothetical protein
MTGKWQERDGYFYENPVSLLNESNFESSFKEMRMAGSLDYAPIDDLNFKLLVSNVQNSNLEGGSTTFNHTATRLSNQNSTAFRNTYANNENLLEFTGNYSKTIGKHRFSYLVDTAGRTRRTKHSRPTTGISRPMPTTGTTSVRVAHCKKGRPG